MRSQRESGSATVAIIMPAFNREVFIAEAIDSVLNQTYPDWKLIIVDDGSYDNTLDIAKSYAEKEQRIEIIELKHAGISAARNCGILHIDLETEFIAFLDSDDIWEPELLETLLHALLAEQTCVGAHAIAREINQNGEFRQYNKAKTWPSVRKNIKGLFPKEVPDYSPTDFSTLAYGCFVPAGATLIRSWVFDKIGLFDQEATIYSDWDMWLRISTIGPFTFVNKALYRQRIHPGNLSKPKEIIFAQEKRMFKRLYETANLTEEQRKILISAYRQHQLYHSLNYFKTSLKKLFKGKVKRSHRDFSMAVDTIRCSLSLRKPF